MRLVEPLLWRARGDALRARFGERVQKLVVDAGFTCPNLDGKKARGGCTYCNNASFSPAVRSRGKLGIREQLERERARAARRSRARRYLAYFQPFTNTYAPASALERIYGEALAFPGVVGLAIGTRPDCVPDDVLDLLESYVRRGTYVCLELGLQTANDETQRRTNRAHGLAEFRDAVRRAAGRGIEIGAHVILGLPGEGRADARRTAEAIAPLPVDVVKVHHFYVCEGTRAAEEYRAGAFAPPELPEYVTLLADFLERLPDRVAIERLCADCRPELLIAPKFSGGVTEVARRLREELMRRGTRQGTLAAAALSVATAAAGVLGGCSGDPEPRDGAAPAGAVAAPGGGGAPPPPGGGAGGEPTGAPGASAATAPGHAGAAGQPASKPPPAPDYWVSRFGGYMSPEFRAEYLSIPDEKERFRKYGEKLLEFQKREQLLEQYRDRLSRTEVERYRALPDYEASLKFIQDRFPDGPR